MKKSVVKVSNLSKKFCKDLGLGMKYTFQDVSKSVFGLDLQVNKLREKEFWALKDVSFSIKHGEILGVIGANGSGKSTLLKLLNGILPPDAGSITLRGKIGALLEIGLGFHSILTGRENIYLNGTILGMKKNEIDKKFDKIVDFADIGDFLDTPVKNYSSGMYVRLGFAIAIHLEPEILLIDEVLSVGDENFRKKSLKKMEEIRSKGTTIIFVSHALNQIRSFCDQVIWLEKGRIREMGASDKIVEEYLKNQSGDKKSK